MLRHHVVRPEFSEPNKASAQLRPGFDAANNRQMALQNDPKFWIANERDIAAANEMARLGSEALPVVIEALGDDNISVRLTAIRACGGLRDPAAIKPLIECMAADNRKYEALREEVRTTGMGVSVAREADLNELCLESLVEIGPKAFGSVAEALKVCQWEPRWQIPWKLGEKYGPAALPYVMAILEDPDSTARGCAADELGKLKDKRATAALVRHLEDSDFRVVFTAAAALGEIGDPDAIPPLFKTMKDSEDNSVRIPAAGSLARLGRDDGLPLLLTLLKSDNRDDRIAVARALGTERIKGTFEPLLSLLGDSNEYVRNQALQTLGELHDPRAIPAIRKLLNDPNDDVPRVCRHHPQEAPSRIPTRVAARQAASTVTVLRAFLSPLRGFLPLNAAVRGLRPG